MSKSKNKPKSLSSEHWQDAFKEFVAEFKGESDRAAVILGAAKLDYMLYQILAKYLLPPVGSRDELLEGDSGLSTFSARINICHRLGLIDSEFAHTLHLIRKIRNSFAHEVSGTKLDTGPHRDRIRELVAPFAHTYAYKFVREEYYDDKAGPSADFFIILSIAVMRLDGVFDRIYRVADDDRAELCPQSFTEPEDAAEQALAADRI
jgi:hypothetical protein